MLCYTGQLLTFQPEPFDGPEFNESLVSEPDEIGGLFRPVFGELMLGNCSLVG